MIPWGCFEIDAPKTFENYQKNLWSAFPFSTVAWIQYTAYYQTKDCTTDIFWKCSKRKRSSEISKIPKSFLQSYPFFLNTTALQSRISDFSKYRLHNFFWVFWNSWRIARKGLHTLRKSIQLDLSTLKRFWIDLLLNFTMTMT